MKSVRTQWWTTCCKKRPPFGGSSRGSTVGPRRCLWDPCRGTTVDSVTQRSRPDACQLPSRSVSPTTRGCVCAPSHTSSQASHHRAVAMKTHVPKWVPTTEHCAILWLSVYSWSRGVWLRWLMIYSPRYAPCFVLVPRARCCRSVYLCKGARLAFIWIGSRGRAVFFKKIFWARKGIRIQHAEVWSVKLQYLLIILLCTSPEILLLFRRGFFFSVFLLS
jgi:hypothetical protein